MSQDVSATLKLFKQAQKTKNLLLKSRYTKIFGIPLSLYEGGGSL